MAKTNIFDVILKTINDVQQKNAKNPREETADPNVFDLIKNKIQQLDEKNRNKRVTRKKSPDSLLDMIRKQIEGARRENKKDPNTPTAPGSVFDNIIKKIEEGPKRQASTGLRRIAQEYNLNMDRLPTEIVQQVQSKYISDRKNFDRQYAQALHDLIKRY